MKVAIAPSLLSADFTRLRDEIRAVEDAGGDRLHVDVMDGRFVPNITIGQPVVRAIAKVARVPLDVHLMIVEPEKYLEEFAAAGAATLIVHAEACVHLHRTVQEIRSLGKLAGVSLNPHTPPDALDLVLPDLDVVLLMTVNPGFGGQAFIPGVVPKIGRVAEMIARAASPARIAVDGGIGPDTADVVTRAGARELVAGASVFGAGDYRAAIQALRAAAARGATG